VNYEGIGNLVYQYLVLRARQVPLPIAVDLAGSNIHVNYHYVSYGSALWGTSSLPGVSPYFTIISERVDRQNPHASSFTPSLGIILDGPVHPLPVTSRCLLEVPRCCHNMYDTESVA
jgi:hypothetical protein